MENKKYEKALISQANLQNTFYTYTNNLQPCAYFWKQLVKGKQTPSVLIPDTLLLNDKESPLIWIYTNSKGKLQKSTNINLKDFVNKITNYCSPNQLAATLKRVTFNDNYINGNDVKLLNARYLQNASFQQLGGQNQSLITIQRYIKSNGNNPFICRTIWRRDRRSQCFIVTSKKSYFDQNEPEVKRFLVKVGESSKVESPSRIVKAIQGKHLTETGKYLQNITSFMKVYRGIDMSQIVGDFIKDEAGNWWLINIKAFQTDNKIVKNPQSMHENGQKEEENLEQGMGEKYEKEKYQKTKICRYCQKSYLQSELTHYMTIKMLIETDRYLLHLGKNYKWLRRSDVMNIDTHCLYQQHKICERWQLFFYQSYRLYMQIQELMEVQNEFLKSMGFIMDKKPKQLLMSLTNEEQLKTESKNKQLLILASCFQNSRNSAQSTNSNAFNNINTYTNNNAENLHQNNNKQKISGFPKTIQLGPNSNIIFDDNNVPIKNDHMINKMIRYRFILYFKQLDQLQLPPFLQHQQHLNYHFFIEYELFGIKNRIKLDFTNHFNPIKNTLQIKKLKINYFFSHSPQDVHQYLNSLQEDFNIKIYAEHKNLKGKNFDSTTTKTLSMKMKTSQKFYNGDSDSVFERSPSRRRTDKKYTIMKNIAERERRVMLGKLSLSVSEFLGNMLSNNGSKICKKDFYKFFSVNEVPHGWGLQGSVGIIPSESYVNTSRMIFFSEDHLIYLPSDNYYYCQHLPEEWIDVVKKELSEMSKGQGEYMKGNTEPVGMSGRQRIGVQMEKEENDRLSEMGTLDFKEQVKLLLNQHSVSSQSLHQSISQNKQKPLNPNNKTSNIKIQDNSYSESVHNYQDNSPKQINHNRNSWKNLLKNEILNYQKSSQVLNRKNSKPLLQKKSSKPNLEKKSSKPLLY